MQPPVWIAVGMLTDAFLSALLGQRVADRVAQFGGSWTFIGLFLFMMAV